MIPIQNIRIEENVYHVLLRLLHQKTGIEFKYYRKKFIEGRIKARMIRIPCYTLEEYYDYLFSHEDEINRFIESFNINYTHFFRDWSVFKKLQELFLISLGYKINAFSNIIKPRAAKLRKFQTEANYKKNLKKKKAKPYDPFQRDVLSVVNPLSLYRKIKGPRSQKNRINIWSAPCASGEEPYSIAMMLDFLKKKISNFPKYKIVASDIDKETLKLAKKGKYSHFSMKEIPDRFENDYFTKEKIHFGHNYYLKPEIINDIEFIEEDITKGHAKNIKYDIIFCRYLLIYFNRKRRHEFLDVLMNQLNSGGLLILGKTEILMEHETSLVFIDDKNQIYLKP